MGTPQDRQTDRLDDWISQRLATLPLVGRAEELRALSAALDEARAGRGNTAILTGEGGVGKTRLARAVAEQAERQRWTIAAGRAYPVETGVPYAIFADALLPLFRQLDPSALTLLTRGGADELAYLFPALASPDRRVSPPAPDDPAALKSRLFWNLSQFLARLAAKQPLLVVLEDLQWADASSLELLHFVARQLRGGGARILILCTYNETDREQTAALGAAVQSLVSLGAARRYPVKPLGPADIEELIRQVFGVDPTVTHRFGRLLHDWTRGNPSFVGETLTALVTSGTLHRAGNTWLGWDVEALDVPGSIRDALVARIARLSAPARAVAELTAVIGTRTSYEVLREAAALPEAELLAALDELRRGGMLTEADQGATVTYEFSQPMLRDAIYAELGLARRRVLHTVVAETLERVHGNAVLDHADELAFHFARGDKRELAPAAVKYLAAAGRQALARSADREAEQYLAAALEQVDRGAAAVSADVRLALVEDLARARERLGDYDAALALWEKARSAAEATGDARHLAAVERHIG
ncbi:MAG: AAA family ATPase, partial [Chloroflexota bacterium]|nr:AAA family ATPase [Chloroflexota bacterium]